MAVAAISMTKVAVPIINALHRIGVAWARDAWGDTDHGPVVVKRAYGWTRNLRRLVVMMRVMK